MSMITIEKLVQGGRGLARQEGQVVLVRGVVPGETISVESGARRKGVQEATVREVVSGDTPLEGVTFCCFSESDLAIYERALRDAG